MFTWICPQCGREVPPSESECPNCAEKAKRARQAEPPSAGEPPAPRQPEAPPPRPPDPVAALREGARQPPQYEVGVRRGVPGWVIALLVAIGLSALGALAYYYVLPSSRAQRGVGQSPIAFEEVPPAGSTPADANRLARFIEVTGFRITEDSEKRNQVQFLVVNHSAADIGDLAGKVHLRFSDATPADPPISSFDFKTTRLGPYESIEFRTPMKTSLRAYEIPDWQYLRADVEIKSPSGL